jgi:hypothetical protein
MWRFNNSTNKLIMSEKKQTPEEELHILKEKYAIAKTTLEAVLWYIVPDDCRTMVYKALDELNDKKPK